MLPMLVADALSFRNYLIEGIDIAIAAYVIKTSLKNHKPLGTHFPVMIRMSAVYVAP